MELYDLIFLTVITAIIVFYKMNRLLYARIAVAIGFVAYISYYLAIDSSILAIVVRLLIISVFIGIYEWQIKKNVKESDKIHN